MQSTTFRNAIEEAESELARLRKEHADPLRKIQALQDFIQSGLALTGQEGRLPQTSVLVPAITGGPIGTMVQKTPAIADQVAGILKGAGKPMHLRDIVRQLRTIRAMESKNPSVVVRAAIERRGKQFKKTKPNTFKLVEGEGVADGMQAVQ
jgi:hypothetical protein